MSTKKLFTLFAVAIIAGAGAVYAVSPTARDWLATKIKSEVPADQIVIADDTADAQPDNPTQEAAVDQPNTESSTTKKETKSTTPTAKQPATQPTKSISSVPTQETPNPTKAEQLTTLVKSAISQKSMRSMADWQKVRAVHNYIIDNVDYDMICFNSNWQSNPPECNRGGHSSFSAYAAAFNKQAVCQGYALFAKAFFDELGLPNQTITSSTHMWNVVLVNGRYLHLDITWDDLGGSKKSYEYFLVNDPRAIDTVQQEHNFNVGIMNSLNAGRAPYDDSWRKSILTQILGADGILGMFGTPTPPEMLTALNNKRSKKNLAALTLCPAAPQYYQMWTFTGWSEPDLLDYVVTAGGSADYACAYFNNTGTKQWAVYLAYQ